MTQLTDPFISSNWGWDNGENGWGEGMNENLIQYAFFHNRRINAILANVTLLPVSPVDGDAYFVTDIKLVYFRANDSWYTAEPPVGMTFTLKSTEVEYKYNGSNLVVKTSSISDVTNLQSTLDAKLSANLVGVANGVAPLGSDNKVPSVYLPTSGSYLGAWDASTNTPTITSSSGTNGSWYIVSVAGTTSINGVAVWSVGDQIRFNGTIWEKIPSGQAVNSVNGQTGVVVLTAANVGATPSSHIGSGGTQHADATTTTSGFFNPSEKIKLSGIANNATVNQTDSFLLSRANHTGSQAQSTITGLVTDLASKQATLVSGDNIKTINGVSLLGSGNIVISSSSGSTTFTGLTDVPDSYVGNALRFVRIKNAEDGVEFVSLGTAAFNNTGDFATSSHTHGNATTVVSGFMTPAQVTKLDSIAAGAEVNVNPDWNATSGDGQILNKPSLAAIATSGSATDLVTGTVNDARLPSVMSPKTFSSGLATSELLFKPSTLAGEGVTLNGGLRAFSEGVFNYGIGVNNGSGGGLEYHADQAGAGNHRWYNGAWNNPVLRMTLADNGNLLVGNEVFASGFGGSGAGLTNLNASNLTSGAVPTARLPFGYSIENTPNNLVSRGADGYIFTGYINTDIGQSTGNITDIYVGQDNNNFIYKTSPAYVLTAMGGVASSSLAAIATSGSASNLISGTVPNARLTSASTSVAGIVQLSDSTFDNSTTLAATADSVRRTYQLASAADSKGTLAINSRQPEQLVNVLGTVSGSVTVSGSSGCHVLATAGGNISWTFPTPASNNALSLTLELTNGGAFTMTWPAGTRWAGGVAPTLTASGTDVLVFTKAGTNNWRGYLSSKDNK